METLTLLPYEHDGVRLSRLLASCDALIHAGEHETFGLVFLDYNMPGFDGFETLSEIKRETPNVAVVMMTTTVKSARTSPEAAAPTMPEAMAVPRPAGPASSRPTIGVWSSAASCSCGSCTTKPS
ncbi:MAG: hypothetical protein B7X11_04105 [Acidobacteria bacterium 37-65-4]|nr:MAG: hypothetical protein B7X11_04105 [Acidobacteria bacterium 37-65-4]